MARAILVVPVTPEILDFSAVEVAADAAAGVAMPNDGNTRLFVRNAGAGAHILTIRTPGTVGREGLAIAEATRTIAAGKSGEIGPFDRELYNQPDGAVYIDSDGTQTEMKFAPIR